MRARDNEPRPLWIGTREEPGTFTQGAPVFPGGTREEPGTLTPGAPCVCLLLQDLLQSCSRGGEEESGRHVL